mmetsp:Transcript_27000/g.60997  ORF Transcript_27000/g.60997 Transcript_27000/m.60997 type:complete len:229 (+) Transcript_27000:1090-1776(+)
MHLLARCHSWLQQLAHAAHAPTRRGHHGARGGSASPARSREAKRTRRSKASRLSSQCNDPCGAAASILSCMCYPPRPDPVGLKTPWIANGSEWDARGGEGGEGKRRGGGGGRHGNPHLRRSAPRVCERGGLATRVCTTAPTRPHPRPMRKAYPSVASQDIAQAQFASIKADQSPSRRAAVAAHSRWAAVCRRRISNARRGAHQRVARPKVRMPPLAAFLLTDSLHGRT